MLIKSVTDIITNSSTEVFAVVDQGTCDYLKGVIENTFKLFGEEINLDDYCTLSPKVGLDWDYHYDSREEFIDNYAETKTEEEKKRIAEFDEVWKEWLAGLDEKHDYHAPWVGCGVDVVWKKEDPRIKSLLEDLVEIVDYYNLAEYDV